MPQQAIFSLCPDGIFTYHTTSYFMHNA